jgi:hypothetical protein
MKFKYMLRVYYNNGFRFKFIVLNFNNVRGCIR